MIASGVVFGCIAYYEWRYLRRHHRSKRAFRIVFVVLGLLWGIVIAAAWLKQRFSLGVAFASLFDPLQRWLDLN